jgi:hypothetical protein
MHAVYWVDNYKIFQKILQLSAVLTFRRIYRRTEVFLRSIIFFCDSWCFNGVFAQQNNHELIKSVNIDS